MESPVIKVLLVDDDVLLGSSIVDELNKRGYDATYLSAAYGVAEAINKINPHVLIFDVEIGKENGIEMAQELFNGNPTLPVIFISSHREDETKEAGLMAGAVAYIEKPFSARLLVAHIDRFVRLANISTASASHILPFGNAQLDTKNETLILPRGSILSLRPMEYSIMHLLLLNLNNYVVREELQHSVWGEDATFYNDQSLNNYVRRVRVLLEKNSTGLEVCSFRQKGYKLQTVVGS
jgi:DNA-binding response OmpR family regulator